jgi:hypothetical protein
VGEQKLYYCQNLQGVSLLCLKRVVIVLYVFGGGGEVLLLSESTGCFAFIL